ncbi:MAG: hypothetical protein ABIR71_11155 [Chthoniobacterales bacterium]
MFQRVHGFREGRTFSPIRSHLSSLGVKAARRVELELAPIPGHKRTMMTGRSFLAFFAAAPIALFARPIHEPYGTSGADTIVTEVISPLPAAGKSAPLIIRLTAPDGQPVTLEGLIVAHTQKIHLLIVDETLTDYHHEHPTPTNKPGDTVSTSTRNSAGSTTSGPTSCPPSPANSNTRKP